jgi:hypothetical protein
MTSMLLRLTQPRDFATVLGWPARGILRRCGGGGAGNLPPTRHASSL